MYSRVALILLCALATPLVAHASITITEIMYAPDGADADHEWIEVCNTGDDSVDLADWVFFENETNHELSLKLGNATLAHDACAVIADDADTFRGDYGSFTGNLFDSAFSLKNTGETLSLKNDTGDVVDTVTYTQDDGGHNDGNTLHRDGDTLTAGGPSPGSFAGGATDDAGAHNTSTDTSANTSSNDLGEVTPLTLYSYESVTIQPPQDVYVRTPARATTTVGAVTTFVAEAYDATGSAVANGLFTWTFGDGGQAHGRHVAHQYEHTGNYTVYVRLEHGPVFDERRIEVSVMPLDVAVVFDRDGEWVEISNNGSTSLDISNWRLVASGNYFSIPERTIIRAGTAVKFPRGVTGLYHVRVKDDVRLVYPDGSLAAVGRVALRVNSEPATTTATSSGSQSRVPTATTVRTESRDTTSSRTPRQRNSNLFSVIGTPVPENNERTSPEHRVSNQPAISSATSAPQAAGIILSKPDNTSNSNTYWYVTIAILLIAGAVGVVLLRPQDRLVVDGFEVVERRDE